MQAGNPENRGKSKVGWYIGGVSAVIISIGIVVVFVIAMANRDNGDTGTRRHRNIANSPSGGPNRPVGAPPRR